MIPPQYCHSAYSPTKCSRLFSLRYVPPKRKIVFVSFLQYEEQQESFKSLPPTEAASMIQCKVIKPGDMKASKHGDV